MLLVQTVFGETSTE